MATAAATAERIGASRADGPWGGSTPPSGGVALSLLPFPLLLFGIVKEGRRLGDCGWLWGHRARAKGLRLRRTAYASIERGAALSASDRKAKRRSPPPWTVDALEEVNVPATAMDDLLFGIVVLLPFRGRRRPRCSATKSATSVSKYAWERITARREGLRAAISGGSGVVSSSTTAYSREETLVAWGSS